MIDEINVFPVPDADTGTNLVATARGAERAAAGVPDDEVPAAAARGALHDAQGNAGTILSQVLAALAQEVTDRQGLDEDGLTAAFDRMAHMARAAIAEPVEGTMLSAIDAAADAAAGAGEDVIDAVVDAVGDAVARTPEQLEVLREAGVVDAGAHGFEVVCHALRGVVTGQPPRVPDRRPGATGATREVGAVEGPRHEVQFLVRGDAVEGGGLRTDLGAVASSIEVVAVDGVVRVHAHTDDVDAVLAVGRKHGEVAEVQVTDLHAQVHDHG